MPTVTRLVTYADLDGRSAGADGGDGAAFSVSARHEAELADGSRVLLLDDRGWSESPGRPAPPAEHIRETTRVVVGPDEPADGLSYEDMATAHWDSLRRTLGRHGVVVDPAELSRLPHDVVLSPRLLAFLGDEPGTEDSG